MFLSKKRLNRHEARNFASSENMPTYVPSLPSSSLNRCGSGLAAALSVLLQISPAEHTASNSRKMSLRSCRTLDRSVVLRGATMDDDDGRRNHSLHATTHLQQLCLLRLADFAMIWKASVASEGGVSQVETARRRGTREYGLIMRRDGGRATRN